MAVQEIIILYCFYIGTGPVWNCKGEYCPIISNWPGGDTKFKYYAKDCADKKRPYMCLVGIKDQDLNSRLEAQSQISKV